jgi:hypothetical protein
MSPPHDAVQVAALERWFQPDIVRAWLREAGYHVEDLMQQSVVSR